MAGTGLRKYITAERQREHPDLKKFTQSLDTGANLRQFRLLFSIFVPRMVAIRQTTKTPH